MQKNFKNLVGHKQTIEFLRLAVEGHHLPPVLLFSGPEGIGKKHLAFILAQSLLCQKPVGFLSSCGACGPCLRIEKRQSESILLVEAENNIIKIEQSREIQKFLSLRSVTPKRFVIVDDVHALNVQAANALLKIFEEPASGNHFFLITSSPMLVLPTIRSRAQRLQMAPLSDQDLEFLGFKRQLPLARGRVSRARRLESQDWQILREQAMRLLQEGLSHDRRIEFGSIKDLAKPKESSQLVVEIWQSVLRDAWSCKCGGNELLNVDYINLVRKLADCEWFFLHSLSLRLSQIEAELSFNVDRSLLMEDFYFRLASTTCG